MEQKSREYCYRNILSSKTIYKEVCIALNMVSKSPFQRKLTDNLKSSVTSLTKTEH